MYLGVAVDVAYEGDEVAVAVYSFAFKGVFKQAACSLIGFVHGFGVGAEEVDELLGEEGTRRGNSNRKSSCVILPPFVEILI